MMDRLDLIRIFVRVVESGSFSATARERGVRQPAISKHVAALEARLGAELIRRSSRTFSVTDAGRDFYESSVRLLEDFDAATAQAKRAVANPNGLLRVMASPTFSRLYIGPWLAEFFRRYPDISVELLTSSTPTSLIEDGVDIAFHGGELSDSSLIAKKIAETSIITVATPQYLAKHGAPEHPDDLAHHLGVIFIQYGAPRDWIFENESGRFVHQPKGIIRTNDAEQMRIAVLSHLGIANAPAWLFAKEFASGDVCPLLTKFVQPTKHIFALRRSGRRLAAKVHVFVDFMEEILARELSTAVTKSARLRVT
jgi:LysR family transcriptional regulator, regulator for bpeEF and oprC